MLDERIKKRLAKKKKVGRRLNLAIAAVVIVTMAIFEYLGEIIMHRFGGSTFKYAEFHLIHTIITIVVLIVATYFILSRYVIKPIYKLLVAIEEVKSGKLVTALEVKSNDEFELLAEEFNEMGFQLRDLMQHKVRAGKYSAASLVAMRIANSLFEPCTLLRTNVKLLKDITRGNSQLEALSDMILKDVSKIEEQLKEISSIEVPKELL